MLEAEAQKLENEIRNLRRQRDQLQFVLEAHRPTCRGDVDEIKLEPTPELTEMTAAVAARPTTLPIANRTVPTVNSLASAISDFGLSFELESTGLTPVVSSAGYGVFLGAGTDFVSPTALIMSPSSLR